MSSIVTLEPGTLVEVLRTKLVHEICVVDSVVGSALILRKANCWERWRWWFKSRRASVGEMAAAAESNEVILKAKTSSKEFP